MEALYFLMNKYRFAKQTFDFCFTAVNHGTTKRGTLGYNAVITDDTL